MEIVTEYIDDKVIFDVTDVCQNTDANECRLCTDTIAQFHNWLLAESFPFVVLDLLDEKQICPVFITELIQIRRRVTVPLLVCGILDPSKKIFESYGLLPNSDMVFDTADEALECLEKKFPSSIAQLKNRDKKVPNSTIIVSSKFQSVDSLEDDIGEDLDI